MKLTDVLNSTQFDVYQKVLLMHLIDERDRGAESTHCDQIIKVMGCSYKCFREKVEPLIKDWWVYRGKKGHYTIARIPKMF